MKFTDRIWTGWWDEPKEGEMVSVVNNSKLLKNQSFAPWGAGEPNGDTMENCGVLNQRGGWNDLNCDKKSCVACQIPSTPVFVLRGKVIPFKQVQ